MEGQTISQSDNSNDFQPSDLQNYEQYSETGSNFNLEKDQYHKDFFHTDNMINKSDSKLDELQDLTPPKDHPQFSFSSGEHQPSLLLQNQENEIQKHQDSIKQSDISFQRLTRQNLRASNDWESDSEKLNTNQKSNALQNHSLLLKRQQNQAHNEFSNHQPLKRQPQKEQENQLDSSTEEDQGGKYKQSKTQNIPQQFIRLFLNSIIEDQNNNLPLLLKIVARRIFQFSYDEPKQTQNFSIKHFRVLFMSFSQDYCDQLQLDSQFQEDIPIYRYVFPQYYNSQDIQLIKNMAYDHFFEVFKSCFISTNQKIDDQDYLTLCQSIQKLHNGECLKKLFIQDSQSDSSGSESQEFLTSTKKSKL